MVQQVNHGVGLKWVRCIITMSGERRDDTCANLPVDACDRFSGTHNPNALATIRTIILWD